MIHHDDGHTEIERVDLTQPYLQDHDVQEELLHADGDEQFLAELEDEGSEEADIDENISLHHKKVQKKQKAWEDLRSETLEKTFQFAGQYILSSCVMCGEENVAFRCLDCSHGATFCQECVLKMHTVVNLYHNVEVLRVCFNYLFSLVLHLLSYCL